jgi:protein neuralized
VDEPLPPPRYANPLVPLSLHRTKGRNVQFVNDRGVAARIEAEFCQGYVFTARPMRPGQTIVVQILATESAYAGSLAIGLTSCDPATLRPCDLPADAELLLDRPEYWVVRRDAANGLGRGDELAVTLTLDGEVRVSRNGSTPVTVMHVDHTLRLWAFVDIYGATQKVRMLTSQSAASPQLRVVGAPPLAAAGGTVLVVSLPPQTGVQNAPNHHQGLTLASAHYIEVSYVLNQDSRLRKTV